MPAEMIGKLRMSKSRQENAAIIDFAGVMAYINRVAQRSQNAGKNIYLD
jgi:hypothetical protein